jgi:hypothetical protein
VIVMGGGDTVNENTLVVVVVSVSCTCTVNVKGLPDVSLGVPDKMPVVGSSVAHDGLVPLTTVQLE